MSSVYAFGSNCKSSKFIYVQGSTTNCSIRAEQIHLTGQSHSAVYYNNPEASGIDISRLLLEQRNGNIYYGSVIDLYLHSVLNTTEYTALTTYNGYQYSITNIFASVIFTGNIKYTGSITSSLTSSNRNYSSSYVETETIYTTTQL
jgi:hypothetical protein